MVPAKNEERAIGPCIESILRQSYEDFELIVVDGASTDATVDVVRSFGERDPRVTLISNPLGIIPVSLNMALQEARGRWFIRVDAHAAIPRDYIARLVGHLSTGACQAAGGRKQGIGRTSAGIAIARVMDSKFGVGGSTYHHGDRLQTVTHVPFGAYDTDFIRRLGGWNESLRVNQDFELDFRVVRNGGTIVFDPAIVADWECRQNIPDLWRQYVRYGGGKVHVALLHPASVSLRHLGPPALVLLLGSALLAGLRRPSMGLALAAPYAAFLLTGTASVATKVPPPSRPYVAPALVSMHVGWGFGFLKTLIARATPSWR
ncbi:glycosyltransferase family 2 protein [Blastococcus sp. SYSU DS1024]